MSDLWPRVPGTPAEDRKTTNDGYVLVSAGKVVLASLLTVLGTFAAFICWISGRTAVNDANFIAAFLGCAYGLTVACLALSYIIAAIIAARRA